MLFLIALFDETNRDRRAPTLSTASESVLLFSDKELLLILIVALVPITLLQYYIQVHVIMVTI